VLILRSPENLTTNDRVYKFSQIDKNSKLNESEKKKGYGTPEKKNKFNSKEANYQSGEDLIVDDSLEPKNERETHERVVRKRKSQPQSDSENEMVQNQIMTKNMETFGKPVSYNFKFDPYKKNAQDKEKEKTKALLTPEISEKPIQEKSRHSEKEEIEVRGENSDEDFGAQGDPSSDDFMSFGHSVSTQKVYNNLAKMFTQLENSIKNPVLLSALVVIESESILVTGGSNDRTLRFWSILTQENGYTLRCEHELKVFNKSITNVKYIENRQLIVAGDSQLLIMFDMTDFFEDKSKKPEPIDQLLNSHWLRCIYHYYSKSKDWLITAKNNTLYYYDFDKMQSITELIQPNTFDENIMCFETVNSEYVLVGNGKSISFLSVQNGRKVGQSRRDHEKLINNILYVKKRKYVLSGGDDGFIFLYKLSVSNLSLNIVQKVSPSGSTPKSFIDSLIYFEEQSMLFCTNRTKSLTIFCFNRNNLLKEKSKITELKFKVTGLYFWKKQVSLLAYSSLVPNIIILGFAGVNINN
jgi:WD40 repeat protein